MWVEKRSGKYLAVERYTDYLTGKQKRVSVMMEKDTAQARNKAKQILQAKIEAGREEKHTSITLKELETVYLNYQKKLYKESTTHRNKIVLDVAIKTIGSDTLCDRLTAGTVIKALLNTGKPNVTLNSYLTRLKAMLRWGYENDLCPEIASKLKAFPDKTERQKVEDKYLESGDLKKLLAGMKKKEWQNLSRILVLSGLRVGEAIALEYDDLDLNQRLIHVTKTFDRTTKAVTSPKTHDSIRDVYMQDELYKLCRKLLTAAKRKALERGYQSNLLFCDDKGQHISYDVYEKYLRENSERILGRRISSHTMRHTMVSLFAESGISIDIISRRIGHHDSRLTRDIYYHITEKQRKKDQEAIKNVSILVGN